MKTYPFCLVQLLNRIALHGDYIYLHVHCTNLHITTTRRQGNVNISLPLAIRHHLLTYMLYQHNPSTTFFYSLFATIVHLYNENYHTTLHSIPYYSNPLTKIAPSHSPRKHRSISTNLPTGSVPPQYSYKQLRPSIVHLLTCYSSTA